MSKSIKFKNNNYLDSSSIVHNKKSLKNILDEKEVYTNEEQKIGKWVDGKPIYRKIISGSTTSENYTIITPLDNPANIVSLKGFILENDGIHTDTIPVYCDNNIKIIVQIKFPQIILTYGDVFKNTGYVLIVEYTKTTD